MDFTSNHPEHCKAGIPYSQSLRIIERCAKPEDREYNLAQLQTKLEERNYPSKLIEKQFRRAKSRNRRYLIFQERKDKTSTSDIARLILTQPSYTPVDQR